MKKYSCVEKEVVGFFKDNCPLYFDRFIEDIEYLKNCRNKYAHLKVDDNTLYTPKDYQVRMLVCSMYEHILSVKAPFIMDLSSIAKEDVEKYSETILIISTGEIDKPIDTRIKEKYLKRMTYDSLKKSYKTFIRLLLVSDSEECKKNICGLHAFVYAMTDHIIINGFLSLFSEDDIQNVFSRITVETLNISDERNKAMVSLILKYPAVMDIARNNTELFQHLSNQVLGDPRCLKYYRFFYPRESRTIYSYFKCTPALQSAFYIKQLYETLKGCADFVLGEFALIMINSVPRGYGFNDADAFMSFFLKHLDEFSIEQINSIMTVYNRNGQCTNRGRHLTDVKEVHEYLEKQKQTKTTEETEENSASPNASQEG